MENNENLSSCFVSFFHLFFVPTEVSIPGKRTIGLWCITGKLQAYNIETNILEQETRKSQSHVFVKLSTFDPVSFGFTLQFKEHASLLYDICPDIHSLH